jgi:CheY-like chemotaxis protein
MPREEATKRHRVLVVDDEESTRLLLAGMLAQEVEADVQIAGTCEQALRLAETHAYDAILLDLMMPGIGGFGVLYSVRRSVPNPTTPIIMVSAVTDKKTIERCLAAGANAYLTKPVRSAELGRVVKEQLAARRRG